MTNIFSKCKALFGNQSGLAQIPLMVALLLMAVAVPAVTKLSQQNQDNRNRAAGSVANCNINNPCPSDQVCTSQGLCINRSATATPMVANCNINNPCPSGQVCTSQGLCINRTATPTGVKCSETTRPSSSCIVGNTIYPSSCNPATGVWYCAVTEVLSCNLTKPCPVGWECTSNQLCVQRAATATPIVARCNINTPCPSGQVCTSQGLCINRTATATPMVANCNINNPCPSGQVCTSQGLCINRSATATPMVANCNINNPCPSGQVCTSQGLCINRTATPTGVKCSETTRPSSSCIVGNTIYPSSCNPATGVWYCAVTEVLSCNLTKPCPVGWECTSNQLCVQRPTSVPTIKPTATTVPKGTLTPRPSTAVTPLISRIPTYSPNNCTCVDGKYTGSTCTTYALGRSRSTGLGPCTTVGGSKCMDDYAVTCSSSGSSGSTWQGSWCSAGCTNGKCNPFVPTPTIGVPAGACTVGQHIVQASLLGCAAGTTRICDCKSGTSGGYWSCFCDADGNGTQSCMDSLNGAKGSNGTWLHLDDAASASCLCGPTRYYQNENGKYFCGSGGSGGNPVPTSSSGGGNPNPTSGGGGNPNPTSGGGNPTGVPTTGGSCKECPSTFSCYRKDGEYKWFASGYVMDGFTLVVPGTTEEPCANVPIPTFKGKTKGDANCDGSIDVTDYSLWHKEFFDGNKGAISKNTWNADFTGSAGVCDGKVDVYDFSLWQKFFNEFKNEN